MTKEDFKVYAQNSIIDINHRIDEIRQRANSVNNNVKEEFDKKIVGLIAKRDELETSIGEYDNLIDPAWETFKLAFTKKVELLQKDFESLFNILSN